MSVFVFGSNLSGRHGAGAALHARRYFGAVMGVGVGRTGNAYAIPTKDRSIRTMSKTAIRMYVDAFVAHAADNPNHVFKVTRIGCGLAGYQDAEIAPMFRNAPDNCYFDEAWKPFLGEDRKYWGHVA